MPVLAFVQDTTEAFACAYGQGVVAPKPVTRCGQRM
jgi:hypothetical protein